MLEEICQYVKKTKGANDWRDLGRWTSIVLQAANGLRTRIVCAYNVGKTKPTGLKTVYQQLLRYIQNNNLDTNPRALMRNDLIAQLKTWLQAGDRIFLFMDANENVIDGQLCSKLAELGFTPWAHRLHGSVPNTHVEGSECIEEFWGSYGLEVTGIQLLSFHEGIGDHRPFLVDLRRDLQLASFCTELFAQTAAALSCLMSPPWPPTDTSSRTNSNATVF
jgi:hypothetical protein